MTWLKIDKLDKSGNAIIYDIFRLIHFFYFPHSHPLVHGSFYTTETGLRPLDLSAPSPDTPGQGRGCWLKPINKP